MCLISFQNHLYIAKMNTIFGTVAISIRTTPIRRQIQPSLWSVELHNQSPRTFFGSKRLETSRQDSFVRTCTQTKFRSQQVPRRLKVKAQNLAAKHSTRKIESINSRRILTNLSMGSIVTSARSNEMGPTIKQSSLAASVRYSDASKIAECSGAACTEEAQTHNRSMTAANKSVGSNVQQSAAFFVRKGDRIRMLSTEPNWTERVLALLNFASAEFLCLNLATIGPKTAARIIRYRKRAGSFRTIDDLKSMTCWTINSHRKFLSKNFLNFE